MKKIITPLVLLIFCFSAYAQSGGKDWRQQIKAQKVAFITEQLSLTPKEAQKFWPIYNTYEDKLNQIRRNDERAIRDAMKKGHLIEKIGKDNFFMNIQEAVDWVDSQGNSAEKSKHQKFTLQTNI